MENTNLSKLKMSEIGLHMYNSVNRWASNFGPHKRTRMQNGNEFLDQTAESFVYAMAKFMLVSKPKHNDDDFTYLQEGIDVLVEKIKDLAGDEARLNAIFDLAGGEVAVEPTEEVEEPVRTEVLEVEGSEVVYR